MKELRSIQSQVENAVRSNAGYAEVTISAKSRSDTKVVHNTAMGGCAIEIGNEVCASTVRPLNSSIDSPPTLQLQASRLDTEMCEIRPHSVVQ